MNFENESNNEGFDIILKEEIERLRQLYLKQGRCLLDPDNFLELITTGGSEVVYKSITPSPKEFSDKRKAIEYIVKELDDQSALFLFDEQDLIPEGLKEITGFDKIEIVSHVEGKSITYYIVGSPAKEGSSIHKEFDYIIKGSRDKLLDKFNKETERARQIIAYRDIVDIGGGVVFSNIFEVAKNFQRKGIGKLILNKSKDVLIKAGFHFSVGYHNKDEDLRIDPVSYFLSQGRYLVEELKDVYRDKILKLLSEYFDPDYEKVFFTVDILDNNKSKYVKPGHKNISISDKLKYKEGQDKKKFLEALGKLKSFARSYSSTDEVTPKETYNTYCDLFVGVVERYWLPELFGDKEDFSLAFVKEEITKLEKHPYFSQ